MSNYLSRIATRNLPIAAPSLMPAAPLMAATDPDPFQQPAHDQPGFDSFQQDQSLAEQQNEPRKKASESVVRQELKQNIETPLQNKPSDIGYIARHIERLELHENKERQGPALTNKAIPDFDEPIKRRNTGQMEDPIDFSKKPKAEDEQNQISSPKKSLIRPSLEHEPAKNMESGDQEQEPIPSQKKSMVRPSFENEPAKDIESPDQEQTPIPSPKKSMIKPSFEHEPAKNIESRGQEQTPIRSPKKSMIKPSFEHEPAKNIESRGQEQTPIPAPKKTMIRPSFEHQPAKNIESPDKEQNLTPSPKKPMIRPSFKNEPVKNINQAVSTANVTRLHPAQPQPINAKVNKPAPKLVIGKITVELVQPAKPAPPRVVNRIVQAPSVSDSSKANKLSFGLGQL